MNNLGKIALAALLASAICVPAYATSGSGSSSGGSSTSAASGSSNAGGANNTASAGAGTTGISASGSGTNKNSDPRIGNGGTLENNIKANIDTSRNLNAMGDKTPHPATGTAGSTVSGSGTNNNSTIGSTANGTISSGTAASRIGTDANVGTNFNGRGFNSNDTDRNGTLNFDEYLSYSRSAATTGQSDARSQFSALDTNNDNFLSRTELSAAGAAETGTR